MKKQTTIALILTGSVTLGYSQTFEHNKIDALKKDYHYSRQKQQPLEPSSGFRLPVFNSVFLIVLISFMFLFAIALLIGNKRGYFKKKHSEFDDDLIFEEVKIDYITKEQIKQLLQTARNQKNYKVAIRSIYLLTIWELGDKEIITISEHKTNYDYNYEIAQAEVRSIFKTITTTYDYIWYGEFTAEQKHFESTERAYKQLISQL